MKQRLGIAAALLGDPELLVLDEPTNGLDPAGISEMRTLILDLADGDRTLLVSSHILSELEHIADWLIVINDGSLLYQGPAERFLGRVPTAIALAPEHAGDLDRLTSLVRAGGHDARPEETELTVPVDETRGPNRGRGAEQGRARARDRPRGAAHPPAEPRVPVSRRDWRRTMIAAFRAELVKVLRRRVLLITAMTTAVFALGSAAVVLAAAEPAGKRVTGRGVTTTSLSAVGGGTEVFTTAVSFAGTFLFVVFVGVAAVEFSRGTFRTMLIYQPRRARLLAGKTLALLAFAAALLAVAEVLTWTAARVLAPTQSVATAQWVSFDALGHGLADYGSVLFWVSGYALLGTALAVLVRSLPVALAIGIAWAGPFEHLLQDAWDPAGRFFPGLLLEAFVAGGTPEVGVTRAFVTVAVYVTVAAAIAGTIFARRDVTG